MRPICQEITALIRGRYPLIYILSFEERRVERHLQQIAKDLNKRLLVWTVTRGLVDAATGRAEKDTDGPLAALEKVLATPPSGAFLYVLKDFHPFLDQEHRWVSDWAPTVRKLRDAAYHLLETSSSLFILSPVLSIPVELEKEITVLEFPLPDREDLTHLLARFEEEYAQRATIQLDARTHEAITGALLGLTEMEAENVICRALINDRRLDASDVSLIISEKGQIIRKSGTLEFHPLREGLEDIGGLRLLKEWLERKRFSFDESAATFGIRPPRGLLLIGVPGCGKSLTAKAIAHAWRMPLLRFDIGKVFGMWLGQSEQNMRRAIRTAEAIAPCILWIDELERGFAGVGNEWDSAATTRVFGTFITWLQEKVSPVYIVATANDVTSLPPELLRKGRFDEIFFVDLPNKHEREEVWRVHLRCRGRNAAQFDIQRLADATEGYAGADIEAVLNEGLETAHADGKRQPVTDDFLKIIRQTLPLSETMKDRIEAMRDWARTRARSASVLKD